ERYAESIQRIREARVKHLPSRVMRLTDSALSAYFQEGMPQDVAGLMRAQERTNATEFLPDVKKILEAEDPSISLEDRKAIQRIISEAEKSGFLSYRRMREA